MLRNVKQDLKDFLFPISFNKLHDYKICPLVWWKSLVLVVLDRFGLFSISGCTNFVVTTVFNVSHSFIKHSALTIPAGVSNLFPVMMDDVNLVRYQVMSLERQSTTSGTEGQC